MLGWIFFERNFSQDKMLTFFSSSDETKHYHGAKAVCIKTVQRCCIAPKFLILYPFCVFCFVELFTCEMHNSFAYLDKLRTKFFIIFPGKKDDKSLAKKARYILLLLYYFTRHFLLQQIEFRNFLVSCIHFYSFQHAIFFVLFICSENGTKS